MKLFDGFQQALDYIEDHLTDEVDYSAAAGFLACSSYNFARIFTVLTGFTLGDYVRGRRLTLAGAEVAATDEKIITIAARYGYEAPDSFTHAFRQFHGCSPSDVRKGNGSLRSVSRLSLKIDVQGGNTMQYNIFDLPATKFAGIRRRISGHPSDRAEADEAFWVDTRREQEVLRLLRRPGDRDWYELLGPFDEEGFGLCIAVPKPEAEPDFAALAAKMADPQYDYHLSAPEIEAVWQNFETVEVGGRYAHFLSEHHPSPMMLLDQFRRRVFAECLPNVPLVTDDRPEILRIHWAGREKAKERHLELYLPVK